jgi:hypothetical protein
MAIFNGSAPAYQGTVSIPTNTAVQIFSTTGTSNPTVNFPAGVNLGAITILNTGLNNCWIGTSSVSATQGVPLKPGEQLTIQNGTHLAAESGTTSWNLYAIAAATTPTTVEVGLVTFPSVV